MSNEIVVAIVSFLGTMVGALGGIVTSSKLVNHRISELEKKVDKHNNFAERLPVVESQIKNIYHEINDLRESEK